MSSKILYLLLFVNFYCLESFAQAKIEFQNTEHDFGKVSEGTLASYDFTFINVGTEPLLINNVKASCGCTTPYWTKEPVMPGKQGKITAAYDSKNRPGAFNKSISVTSNAQNPNVSLYIKGVVVSKENVEKVFSDSEIAASPKANIEKNLIQLGKVEKGQTIPFSIDIKNSGKTDLSINQVKAPCNCIRLDNNGKKIGPGETETISFIFSANLLGNKKEPLTIYTNDITNPESTVNLEVEVVESLSNKSILKEKSSTLTF